MYLPHPGDIGLTAIKGRVGGWIKVGQLLNGDGWTYQHAMVVAGIGDIPNTHRNVMRVVEAEPSGAKLTALSEYDDRMVVYLRCPAAKRDAVAAAALSLVGRPYAFEDYAALALHRLGLRHESLRLYIENSGHMICSQLADRAAELGGWHLFADNRWHGYVTPGALNGLYERQELGFTI